MALPPFSLYLSLLSTRSHAKRTRCIPSHFQRLLCAFAGATTKKCGIDFWDCPSDIALLSHLTERFHDNVVRPVCYLLEYVGGAHTHPQTSLQDPQTSIITNRRVDIPRAFIPHYSCPTASQSRRLEKVVPALGSHVRCASCGCVSGPS